MSDKEVLVLNGKQDEISNETDSTSESGEDSEGIDIEKGIGMTWAITEEGVDLEFKDVHMSVEVVQGGLPFKKKKMKKEILKGLSGKIPAGSFVAIMGSSGAGKTTFLNLLTAKNKPTQGCVLIDGKRTLPGRSYPKQAYVRQQDFLFASFTPTELLRFSADLRLPPTVTQSQKDEKIQQLLKELSLEKCKNTRVGNESIRGLSGGEQKRLSIAIELITDPSILYLDEPTSGLDSTTAFTTVDTLRRLSDSGRTVIMTIHQPSSDIFNLFKDLILMAEGKIVYFGPAAQAVDYFASVGYKCPKHYNPADYFFQVLNTPEAVPVLIRSWEEKNTSQATDPKTYSKYPISRRDYAQGYGSQFWLCSKRAFLNFVRDKMQTWAQLMSTIIMGLLLGLVYLQRDWNQESVQDRTGAMIFALMIMAFTSAGSTVSIFPLERSIVEYEYSNRMYSIVSYYMSKFLSELPFRVIFPTLFSIIGYWMIGFRATFDAWLIFTIVMFLVANIGQSIGLFIGSAFDNLAIANSVMPILIIPFVLFAGFFLNQESTPDYFIWIQYISFFYYGMEIIVVNEFKPDQIIACPNSSSCPYPNGSAVLERYGYSESNLGRDFGLLVAIFLAFRVLGLAFLAFKLRKTK